MPGAQRVATATYDATTGEALTQTVTGQTGTPPHAESRTTTTVLNDGTQGASFDPGGAFLPGWLTLPQPQGLRRSTDGPRGDVQDVTQWVYYPVHAAVPPLSRGRLAAIRTAGGHVTRFEDYDLFGNAKRLVDPNGVITERTFDVLGRLLSATTKSVAGCNTSADPLCATDITVSRSYASTVGPLSVESNPAGVVTYEYDLRGRLSARSRGSSTFDLKERVAYTYDLYTGKKSSEKYQAKYVAQMGVQGSAWVAKRSEGFEYDSRGQLRRQTHADGSFVEYTYDPAGAVASVTDENHSSVPDTTYEYDSAARLKKVTQRLSTAPGSQITTQYTYDLHGNLTSVTDPNGNVTTYVYDDFAQVLSQTSPVSGTTTYAYDAAGNLATTIDANGATTTRTYDPLSRVTSALSTRGAASEGVNWTYDQSPFGIARLAAMTDPAGATGYTYSRTGQLLRETRTEGPSTYETKYRYDAAANRSRIVYPSGAQVDYTFDYAGRPLTASIANVLPFSGTLVSSARYLPYGPAAEIVYGNGTLQTMEYDTRYRMTSNMLSSPAGVLVKHHYGYDPSGDITSIDDELDARYNRTFGYDDLHRLVTANTGTAEGSALWGNGSFTYDAMGNLRSARLGEPKQTLGYAAYFTYAGTTPKLSTVRRTSFESPDDPPGEAGVRGVSGQSIVGYHDVTYDAAGNELQYLAMRSYSPRSLLESVTDTGELPWEARRIEYGYDGRGIRVVRSELQPDGSKATRHYTYSPEFKLLAITGDDAPNVWSTNALSGPQQFVWFNGRPLAQIAPDAIGLRWYFDDYLGTPLVQTNASAAIVWQAEYEPYGDVWAMRVPAETEELQNAAAEQPLRFPGQEVAMKWEGTEERYNIFRWYRAGWGRYTQGDPIGLTGGINLYRYADTNPTRFADALGLAVTNNGQCIIYVKEEGSGTTHPLVWGETWPGSQDGFADPCGHPNKVFKTVDGVSASTSDTGVDASWWNFLGGGWKGDAFLKERQALGDTGWNELFSRSKPANCECKCHFDE